MPRLAKSPRTAFVAAVTEDSGATTIVPVPQINSGLEKAVVVEIFIVVQIQVRHEFELPLRVAIADEEKPSEDITITHNAKPIA